MNIPIFLAQFKHDLWNEKLKFLILFLLFTFQVLTSIISIFYLEELLTLFGLDFINPTPPSGAAAFLDYFADQFFFGILIISLGTMNVFASEIEAGSICFSLTRPISRAEYTCSRLSARLIGLILPFLIATLIGWIYMGLFFESFPLNTLLFALIPFILLFIYIGVLTSVLSSRTSSLTAGLGTIAIIIVQFTISAFKPIELLSPFTLASFWTEILSSSVSFDLDHFLKLVCLIIWSSILLILTIYSMKTRDL